MHQFYISFKLFSSIGKFEAFWIPFGITPNKAPPWIFCFFFFHKKDNTADAQSICAYSGHRKLCQTSPFGAFRRAHPHLKEPHNFI